MTRDEALRWVRNVRAVVQAIEAIHALELTNRTPTAETLQLDLHEAFLEDLPELESFLAGLDVDEAAA